MKNFFKRLFVIVLILAVAFVAIRYGNSIYFRFFGGNTAWISERFSEELKAKNEMVVLEVELTGQEVATQNAWLLGTVQEVTIPYTFTMNFVVDLSKSSVEVKGNTILVSLPAPKADYAKLTVDEGKMKRYDWLYPLTPERYSAIQAEIETKLIDETATKQSNLDEAWNNAVQNMESLFRTIAYQSQEGMTAKIEVVQITPAQAEATKSSTTTSTITPAQQQITSPDGI